jgi:carbon monoxide dehydrogenase subunit G
MVWAGKIRVQAPIRRVWDALLEPETLQACIPGAEQIERLDERQYHVVVKQKIGPLAARFQMGVRMTTVEAPTRLEMEGKGADMGKLGRIVHKTRIDLRETAAGVVEISYTIDAHIGGTLALFGERIMQTKAKKMEAEFTQALQERLSTRA